MTVRFYLRVLAVATAAALTGALLRATMQDIVDPNRILGDFARIFLYSCCVSMPAASTLHYLGHRSAWTRGLSYVALTVVVLLGATVVGCLMADLILVAVGILPANQYWPEFSFAFRFGVLLTLTFGLSMSFYEVVRGRLEAADHALRAKQIAEERAQKLLAEARLSSLESRIHPHFLFNTLNSVSSLIPTDPARAEAMIGQLASLLRFSLNANATSLVPLNLELKIVRDYLEIEKTRFGGRLQYRIEIPPELDNLPVPPLSVQSLVENSVKHVIAGQPQGGEIVVTAKVDQGRVQVQVQDTGAGFELGTIPEGHGLDQLSGRLALLFGPNAQLETCRTTTHAAVRILFPKTA